MQRFGGRTARWSETRTNSGAVPTAGGAACAGLPSEKEMKGRRQAARRRNPEYRPCTDSGAWHVRGASAWRPTTTWKGGASLLAKIQNVQHDPQSHAQQERKIKATGKEQQLAWLGRSAKRHAVAGKCSETHETTERGAVTAVSGVQQPELFQAQPGSRLKAEGTPGPPPPPGRPPGSEPLPLQADLGCGGTGRAGRSAAAAGAGGSIAAHARQAQRP